MTTPERQERRVKVARIIQEKFFPWPPTSWATMPEHQKRDFLECADEIFAALKSSAG